LHLHRNRFELTKVNGVQTSGVRKDVVPIKSFQTIEVDFVAKQKGLTLFHCHQHMHMDQGFKTLMNFV
jgi:FtsP/CotA-like multicopper oxidase with cupredoxin domain